MYPESTCTQPIRYHVHRSQQQRRMPVCKTKQSPSWRCVSTIYQPVNSDWRNTVEPKLQTTFVLQSSTTADITGQIRGVDADIKPYWNVRGELTIHQGLLLYGTRIVIPKTLQRETLTKIHQGHQGVQRCCLRAKVSVWWPGISQQIDNFVKQCPTCVKESSPNSEPMMQTELPAFPWQRVGSDLFVLNGVSYLLIVDYFSRFPEAIKLKTTTSASIIEAFKTVFSRHGIPETVMSDNGPQYASQEFTEFARSYDFCHVTSSPHFPQSNGQAERTVQTVKKLLKESDDPYMALLNYRTTSFPWCGLSPAQLLMGRQLRANLPLTEEQLCPQWPYLGEFRRQNNLFKSKQKRDYDRRHRVRSLPLIPDDSEVWIPQVTDLLTDEWLHQQVLLLSLIHI